MVSKGLESQHRWCRVAGYRCHCVATSTDCAIRRAIVHGGQVSGCKVLAAQIIDWQTARMMCRGRRAAAPPTPPSRETSCYSHGSDSPHRRSVIPPRCVVAKTGRIYCPSGVSDYLERCLAAWLAEESRRHPPQSGNFPRGMPTPHLIRGSSGSPESIVQSLFRSVYPFLQGSPLCLTHTDTPTTERATATSVSTGRI